jgi:hypothetical protein
VRIFDVSLRYAERYCLRFAAISLIFDISMPILRSRRRTIAFYGAPFSPTQIFDISLAFAFAAFDIDFTPFLRHAFRCRAGWLPAIFTPIDDELIFRHFTFMRTPRRRHLPVATPTDDGRALPAARAASAGCRAATPCSAMRCCFYFRRHAIRFMPLPAFRLAIALMRIFADAAIFAAAFASHISAIS